MASRNHDGESVTSTGAISGEGGGRGGAAGTCKEAEIELLLNDPNVAIEPARVWHRSMRRWCRQSAGRWSRCTG